MKRKSRKVITLTVIGHDFKDGDLISFNNEYREYKVVNSTATELYLKRLGYVRMAWVTLKRNVKKIWRKICQSICVKTDT